MSDLYIKKSFTGGNFKEGDLEFVFGMKRSVAKHLTGSATVNTDYFVGIAQQGGLTRVYGLPRKDFELLGSLLPEGWRACAVHNVQAWTYSGGTVSGEDIGPNASVGGFATRSSNMRCWDDSLGKDRFEVEELTYGPGFIEFRVEELTAPDHGGRQAHFDPYARLREVLGDLGLCFTENAEGFFIKKGKPE